MSTIAKVNISLGLLSIPVKITAAARAEGISFNLLHKDCHGRIKQLTYCPTCDKNITRTECDKGYEYEKDKYVVLTEDEIKSLNEESTKILEITSTCKADEVDALLFESSFYLEPDLGGLQGYKILLAALEQEKRYAVANITMHQRSQIVIVRPKDGVLVFHTMYYADEVRPAPNLQLADVEVKAAVLKMACDLLKASSEPFRHAAYTNSYTEAALKLIEEKKSGAPATAKKTSTKGKGPVDIMDALAGSLKLAGSKKGKKVA